MVDRSGGVKNLEARRIGNNEVRGVAEDKIGGTLTLLDGGDKIGAGVVWQKEGKNLGNNEVRGVDKDKIGDMLILLGGEAWLRVPANSVGGSNRQAEGSGAARGLVLFWFIQAIVNSCTSSPCCRVRVK